MDKTMDKTTSAAAYAERYVKNELPEDMIERFRQVPQEDRDRFLEDLKTGGLDAVMTKQNI